MVASRVSATVGNSPPGRHVRPRHRGAAVADLEVPDQRRDLGQQGHVRAHEVVGADLGVRDARPDPHGVGATLDVLEFGQPRDVDQVVEMGQPQREHGGETLAAGQDLAVVPELVEQVDDVFEITGTVVGEWCRFHEKSQLLCTRSV